MRIALIGPANPYRGGIAKFYDTLAADMHKHGHELFIVNFSLQYPSFLFPGKTQYTDAIEVPYKSLRLINSIWPLSWFKSAHAVKEFNPDIVVFRYWMPFMAPCLGTIALLLKKFRLVAVTDNILPHERHIYDSILTRFFLCRIGRVVCMSDKVKEELLALGYHGKIAYHPHPVYNSYASKVPRDIACEKLSIDPQYRYALFFGFIREYKGLDILLEAWKRFKGNNIRLIVAGEFYSDKTKYQKLIDELGESVIVRSEYIPESEVNLYFSVADLIIQPYRSASQSGITGIAYNYGVPMVITDVGGLKESVTDGVEGFVTKVDSNSIADAVERYFKENRMAEFSANMEKRVGEFSWEGMTECIVGD